MATTECDCLTPLLGIPQHEKLIRRIDWRLLPILGVLYALSLIDRTNISIARVVGLDEDLGLNIGSRFSIVVGVYFVPYTLLQLPSNLLLRKVGPRKLLSFFVISWGAVQLAMGFVHEWKALAFLRALLGALEAGFFPSMVYLISTWYTRHQVQTRLAVFYVIASLLGSLSTFFAYGLSKLDGTLGVSGWAWIFIIEGGLTMAFGLLAWVSLPGFPHEKNGFLSPEETAYVLDTLERDRGDTIPDVLTWKKLFDAFNWLTLAYSLMFLCSTLSAYANGFFATLIMRGLGWSVSSSLFLMAPITLFSAISSISVSYMSDKTRSRAPFIAGQCLMTICGWILTGFSPSNAWRCGGLFLSSAGSSGTILGILAYSSNNIVSHSKRAIVSSVIVSAGGIGGFLASFIFNEQSAPGYIPGIILTILSQIALLIILASTSLHFHSQNKGALGSDMLLQGQPGFLGKLSHYIYTSQALPMQRVVTTSQRTIQQSHPSWSRAFPFDLSDVQGG